MKKTLLLGCLMSVSAAAFAAVEGNGTFTAVTDKNAEVTYQVTATVDGNKLTINNFNDSQKPLDFTIDLSTGSVTSGANVVGYQESYSYVDGGVYDTVDFYYCDINKTGATNVITGKFSNTSDNQSVLKLSDWGLYTDAILPHIAFSGSLRFNTTITFDFAVPGLVEGSDGPGGGGGEELSDIEGLWHVVMLSFDEYTYYLETINELYSATIKDGRVYFAWQQYVDPNGNMHSIRLSDFQADYDPENNTLYIPREPLPVQYASRTLYQLPVLYNPEWESPILSSITAVFNPDEGTIAFGPQQALVWLENNNIASPILQGPIMLVLAYKDGVDLTQTSVGAIGQDEDAPARYFNLNGVELKNPTPGTICIKVQGGKATKMIAK